MADRWHVGFTDLGGGHGMLGQVEGRTADDVAYWLASQPAAWRDQIRYVAIDMCTVFVAAIRRYLPNATIVVDHFHVVQLANDTVAEVRRRTATMLRGRRGRGGTPSTRSATCCAATVKTCPRRRSRSCGTPWSTSANPA